MLASAREGRTSTAQPECCLRHSQAQLEVLAAAAAVVVVQVGMRTASEWTGLADLVHHSSDQVPFFQEESLAHTIEVVAYRWECGQA